jgi:hypothetical protein
MVKYSIRGKIDMKNHSKTNSLLQASVGLLLLLSSLTVLAEGTPIASNAVQPAPATDAVPYQGHLLIYVTEPLSRWNMQNQQPYHFASLGLADDEDLSIPYQETYTKSITWNGDVTETNVMVMAAVFNPEPHSAYAYPPASNLFEAHYVDAAAAATPGNTSYNTVNVNFTHTVFVEEGTATWCQYCPAMATALHGIYESHDYPFYYVALVDDKSPGASTRLRTDYNVYGFPTSFFDGGYKVYVGGDSNQGQYRTRIKSAGKRDVQDLNLSLSVDYIGSGDLRINVSITNNEEIKTPIIQIGNATGGLSGITISVANVGTANATNAAWNITVKGGFLKLINTTDGGTATIPMASSIDIKTTSSIFGLGKIQLTVVIGGATKTFNGFIIGPYIIIK